MLDVYENINSSSALMRELTQGVFMKKTLSNLYWKNLLNFTK